MADVQPIATSVAASPNALAARTYYLPQLDILRFFAFFAVFIGDSFPASSSFYERFGVPHALSTSLAAACAAGPFGVDLFFVLSAYLITTLLLRERQLLGRVNTGAFYLRRALRIWPLYFVFLLGYFFLQRFIPHEAYNQPLARGALVPFVFFVGNIEIMRHPMLQVVHLWSISVEEQFYLCWGAILKFAGAHKLPWFAGTAILVALVTRVYLQHVQLGPAPGMAFVSVLCNTLARLDTLAMGVLVATGTIFAAKLRWPRLAITAALIAAIVAENFLPRSKPALPNVLLNYLIVAIACSLIVRACLDLHPGTGPLARALAYLGKISFGMYVYSPIAQAFAYRWAPGQKEHFISYVIPAAISLALTVAAAFLSFELLERPFLKLKTRFTYVPSRPA